MIPTHILRFLMFFVHFLIVWSVKTSQDIFSQEDNEFTATEYSQLFKVLCYIWPKSKMMSLSSFTVFIALIVVCLFYSGLAATTSPTETPTYAPTETPTYAPTYSSFCGTRENQDFVTFQNNTNTVSTLNPECYYTTIVTTIEEVTLHTTIVYDP